MILSTMSVDGVKAKCCHPQQPRENPPCPKPPLNHDKSDIMHDFLEGSHVKHLYTRSVSFSK